MVKAGRMACSPAPPGYHPAGGVESLARREPLVLHGEEVDEHQRDEEVRRGLEEHQHGQRPVQPAAVPPAGQDAEEGTDQEGDHRRGADQDQCPRDRLIQDLGDRGREVGQVRAEVEVEDVGQVGHILRPERPAHLGAADHLAERLVGLGRQVGVLRQDDRDRVTGDRARDEEVECDRHPRRHYVEGEAAEYERHAFLLPFCDLVVDQLNGVGQMEYGAGRLNPGHRIRLPGRLADLPAGIGGHVLARHRAGRAAAA